MKKTYEIKIIKATETLSSVDISVNKEQQCGMFKNTVIESAKNMISLNLVPSITPIGYMDENINKIVLVKQSDIFNHMLALLFPDEMGFTLSRFSFDNDNTEYEFPVIVFESMEVALISSYLI